MIPIAWHLFAAIHHDSTTMAAALRAAVAADTNTLMNRPAISDVREVLISAYQRNGWQPFWSRGDQPTGTAGHLLAEFAVATERGLDPAQYDAARLAAAAASLAGRGEPGVAGFDVAMSAAAARYALALDRGRVAPAVLHPTLNLPREGFDAARFLNQLGRSPDPARMFRGLEPDYLQYRLLLAALTRYRGARDAAVAAQPDWPARLVPGDTSGVVPELRRLLHLVGDLGDRDAARGAATDSLRYDTRLIAAVGRFHARTGGSKDSVIESGIRTQLLSSLDERIRQMTLALERWRWLPRSLPPVTLFVNIPAFRLATLDGSTDRTTPTLAMDVVVGKALENDTPLLATRITSIQTHPVWVVPRAIALKEIQPPALRDIRYLARHHYQLVHRDSVVADTRANVRRIGDEVEVRQTAGPWNSLGRLKFVTPNSVDIYLHDTPERRFFRQARRDFSHGCIRVADPVALAEFVLRDDSTWTPQRLQAALADTVPQLITLHKAVPVYIIYQTVSVKETGELSFYPDLYGNDRRLADALSAGYPYPAASRPAPRHSP